MDDLITKGLKNIVGGAATAGGVGQLLQYLERLDGRLAHLEKTFTGSIGSWDQERLASVQFQTYPKYQSWPSLLKVFSMFVPGGGPYPVTIRPTGNNLRVCGASLSLQSRAGALADEGAQADITALGFFPNRILRLEVVPSTPHASIMFVEPYPSISAVPFGGGTRETNITGIGIDVYGSVVNPASVATIQVFYFDLPV